jgi:polysaccharide export outer membrane protein
MKRLIGSFLVVIALFGLPSCRYFYPNTMFKMKDYQFFELAQKQIDQYVIQPGDEMSVRVYARDGFKLVDVIGSAGFGGAGSSANSGGGITSNSTSNYYPVDNEGFVRLPIVGELFVKGYTEKELQRILADKYAGLFVEPFVIAKVENRRALVFKGSFAAVVPLNFSPTNLLEVIARSGGLDQNLKAYNIKVIRGDMKNPEVILIDLSTLEGMRRADLIVQSNDIIYIEQKRTNVATLLLTELVPYLGLITTITTVILLAKAFGK